MGADDRKPIRRRRHDDDEKRSSSSKKSKLKRRHDEDDDPRSNKKSRRHHRHDSYRNDKRSKRDNDDDRDINKRLRRHKHSRRDDRSVSDSSSTRSHRKKKSSKRSSKKHKKAASSSKSKNRGHKIKKPDKSLLIPLGEVVGKPPSTLIDPEQDYFTFHQHFWVYLYREEGVAFNDLTSEESHQAFERFSSRYNKGDLEVAYYDSKGFPRDVLDESKTTKHAWSFQTNEREQKGLEALQEGVRKLTEYEDPSKVEAKARGPAPNAPAPYSNHDQNRRGKTPEEWSETRKSNKRLKDHVRTVQEELTGGKKDPGRERQMEKRREQADRQHGAARDREEARTGGVELSDSAIYGGDGSDFQNALARERQRKANRQQKQTARIEELQNREKERQEEMLAKLGLTGVQPGQKITIAPRQDTPK